jgi:outer membrane receptor protein involved in Fe transport
LLLALCLLQAVRPAAGQASQGSSDGVRFLLAAWSPAREADANVVPVLRRRVSLDLTRATLGEALREITRQADLEMVYSRRVVPLDSRVSLHARDLTVAAALTEILAGVSVDVSVTLGGALALVPRVPRTLARAAREAVDSATLMGRVTERASGSAIAGAIVAIEGTTWSAVTGADGRYRIDGVTPGDYVVGARYIGYTPTRVRVTVRAGDMTAVDFALQRSTQRLDQLVVTGTLVPTEVKALPTPVSIIDEEDIALQRPQTTQEVFRKAVPGAVTWVSGDVPYNTQFSVRGGSSLSPSAPSMKIFVDGVNVANAGFAQVDPSSIARVEVIRGPQAASIYGSEAIGGVIQIFTKRGDQAQGRPQVSAEAGLGVLQTPYAGFDGVFRQEYKASVRGAGSEMSYNLGTGYARLGDWLPNGEVSRQSTPSVYGGMNYAAGIVSADISGRYYTQNGANRITNPELLRSGFAPLSRPSFQPLQTQNQTLGARLTVTPKPWWRNTVTVGLDRYTTDIAQTRPRLTTPADTLLQVSSRLETKPSIGFTTSVEQELGPGVSASLVAGFEHWSYRLSNWSTTAALTTTGSIQVPAGRSISATRTITNNTGYFTQAQLGFREVLFVTAGVRAEENTDFGDSLGTPLSPRIGLAHLQTLGRTTLKFRGSWGRAIRAPSPGRRLGFESATVIQLANPELGPERQHGWDAGIDAVFGRLGSLSITYYDQTADNLADAVVVQTTPVPTQQFRNIGRVKNTGVEIEATAAFGAATLQGQYGYTRARIDRLSPTYDGDLRVGDQVLLRPKHTAGLSVTLAPSNRTAVSAGLVYVGSWTGYDDVAQFRCLGGTGPCRPTLRDYHMAYPALVKMNASVSQQLTPSLSGFASVDNLTNNDDHENTNLSPVMGRSTIIGLRLQY